MPSASSFERLMRDDSEPSAWHIGLASYERFVVESSEDQNFHMGRQSFDADKVELAGRIKVDGSDSIQKTIGGPFVEHDAPTGLIPSTLFTPFPRDMLGIDYEYIELLGLMATAAAFGVAIS